MNDEAPSDPGQRFKEHRWAAQIISFLALLIVLGSFFVEMPVNPFHALGVFVLAQIYDAVIRFLIERRRR